jgi:hypothetical protein
LFNLRDLGFRWFKPQQCRSICRHHRRKVGPAILHVGALVLVIDPFDKNQNSYDADAVSERHQEMLFDLVEPNTLPVVVRFYSTEPLPSELVATLAKLPETSTYIRRE